MRKLFKLFLSTLYLSAFTFGGGYVIVSLMKKKFVDDYHWIEENEMLDLIAIAQVSPGAIAVNGAIVLGYKIYGILGIIVCVIATIIPPLIIISIISLFYNLFKDNLFVSLMLEGMQAGVVAIICNVVYEMFLNLEKNSLNYVILIGSFIASYYFKVNVAVIIVVCIIIGLIKTLAKRFIK